MTLINKDAWSQILYTTLVGATLLCTGMSIAWSSSSIPYLSSGKAAFTITSNEASWVVSLLNLGVIVSCFYTRFALDIWGRRTTLLSAGVMFMVSWLLFIFGNGVWYLYIGRISAGIGFGSLAVTCIVYVGEIASKEIRGRLNVILILMSHLGYTLSYTTGVFMPYKICNYIYATLTLIIFGVAFAVMPESPYFHIKNKNKYAAEKALHKLRASKNETYVAEEVDEIEKIVQAHMKNESSLKELFTNKLNRKSLVICLSLNIFLIASCNFIIVSYIQTIIEKVGLKISPKITPIVYGFLQLLFAICPVFILDKFGRKKLLLTGLAGVAVAQISLGAFFYIQSHVGTEDELLSTLRWIPFVALMLFCFSFNIGMGPVTMVLEGELFATNIKTLGMATGTIFYNIVSISFVKFYQIFADSWGLYLPFWLFSLIIIFAIVLLALILPETKGKSFDVIQDDLNKGNFFTCKRC